MNILVLNSGSATLKFGLYQMPDLSKASTTTDSATVLASGSVEPMGARQAELKMFLATQKPTKPSSFCSYRQALFQPCLIQIGSSIHSKGWHL